MKVIEFLDKIYKKKKDGSISHHAKKFLENNGLDLEQEITIQQAIILSSQISNKDKRAKMLEFLAGEITVTTTERKDVNLREVSYRDACKFYHPDNQQTGSNVIFQFLQNAKYSLWDYQGSPRREICDYEWKKEKAYKEGEGLL